MYSVLTDWPASPYWAILVKYKETSSRCTHDDLQLTSINIQVNYGGWKNVVGGKCCIDLKSNIHCILWEHSKCLMNNIWYDYLYLKPVYYC